MEAARQTGARVVIPSTASVCGRVNTLPLSESASTRPVSPYAAGKAAIEAYASAYHAAYGVDVKIARLFSVYGPTMRRFAIHDIIKKIEADPQRIEILGDGNQVRDYLHISDAVRGLQFVAEHGDAGETYNVATGDPVRLIDLGRTIAELMGHPEIEIRPTGQSFPGDTPAWYADVTKIRELGFSPRVTLREGLAETIRALTGPGSEVYTVSR
jgi:UDP-glucose 4-epimerase